MFLVTMARLTKLARRKSRVADLSRKLTESAVPGHPSLPLDDYSILDMRRRTQLCNDTVRVEYTDKVIETACLHPCSCISHTPVILET